jgi:hypothetical protein
MALPPGFDLCGNKLLPQLAELSFSIYRCG